MNQETQRRLSAIVSADVVGFTRLMQADEIGTHRRLKLRFEEMVRPRIAAHGGRLFKLMGDGLLAEFPSVVAAAEWAIEVQTQVAAEETGPEGERLAYRVGVNLGDVIVDGDDLYGDGVNLAARLQEAAETGGVCLSDAAHHQVRGKITVAFSDGGEIALKNMAEAVRVWRWSPEASEPAARASAAPVIDKPSIAVLPFDNMSTDAEQAYFADGITEDLITGLSRIRWLHVIARNSTFVYKGQAVDVRRVADELGVRYVLEGSVRKAGSRVRITAQLIDAATSNHVWAERYDRELTDIFEVQDEITERVAGAIEPAILAAEGLRARDRSGEELGAWELVMQGVSRFWRCTEPDAAAAEETLTQATERYPGYAPAHNMLAFLLLFSGHVGWRDLATVRPRAEALAEKAQSLDDGDAWTHLAFGYLTFMDRQTDAATRAFSKSIALNPNFAVAYGLRSFAWAHAGQSEPALADAKMAFRLSPRDPLNTLFHGGEALAHFMADRYDDSVEIARRAIQERPGWFSSYRMECTALARAGRQAEAEASLGRLLERQPKLTANQLRAMLPYPTAETMEKFVGGLVLAGLPED